MDFIKWVKPRRQLLNYLLIADPDEDVVSRYLNQGEAFALVADDGINDIIAVALVIPDSATVVELKNLVVTPDHQRHGYGSLLIRRLVEYYQDRGMDRLVVGTANSSTGNLEFYRQNGFVKFGRKRGFFDQYLEPIFENGIQAHDMILLVRKLRNEN